MQCDVSGRFILSKLRLKISLTKPDRSHLILLDIFLFIINVIVFFLFLFSVSTAVGQIFKKLF